MTTRKDITIPQADTYRLVITVVGGPISLSGYTGEMQVRRTKASAIVLADVPPECFAVDAGNRQVVMEITDELTGTWDWPSPSTYDIHIDGPEGRWRLIEGLATLNETVTR